MEVSHVRRRLAAAVERAKRTAQDRRSRAADAQRGYDAFLSDVAVPVARMLANALKAEGYLFTLATPGAAIRLAADKGRDDYVEVTLDARADPPAVVGRISHTRGSRTLTDERPVKPGAAPQDISEEELLEFLVTALEPWLER